MLPVRRSGTCGHCAPLRRRLCKSSNTEVVSSALDALRQLSVRLGNVKILVDHNALEILTKVRAAHVRMRRAPRCVRTSVHVTRFHAFGFWWLVCVRFLLCTHAAPFDVEQFSRSPRRAIGDRRDHALRSLQAQVTSKWLSQSQTAEWRNHTRSVANGAQSHSQALTHT